MFFDDLYKMEFVTVTGRRGGNLYYVVEDKHLYVRKTSKDSGKVYLACYNTALKNDDLNGQGCAARCTLDEANGLCFRNSVCHNNHENHEVVFRDL